MNHTFCVVTEQRREGAVKLFLLMSYLWHKGCPPTSRFVVHIRWVHSHESKYFSLLQEVSSTNTSYLRQIMALIFQKMRGCIVATIKERSLDINLRLIIVSTEEKHHDTTTIKGLSTWCLRDSSP